MDEARQALRARRVVLLAEIKQYFADLEDENAKRPYWDQIDGDPDGGLRQKQQALERALMVEDAREL